jgi:hypothetical protein
MSIRSFRIKRKAINVLDKIKHLFVSVAEFFHLVKNHEATEKVSYHVKKVSRKISSNISNNNKNWKHRIASGPSFEIKEDDG